MISALRRLEARHFPPSPHKAHEPDYVRNAQKRAVRSFMATVAPALAVFLLSAFIPREWGWWTFIPTALAGGVMSWGAWRALKQAHHAQLLREEWLHRHRCGADGGR